MRAIVSRTASRTAAGSAARSFFARRVRRSSGKPELAPHFVKRKHAAGLDVLVALAKRCQSLVVLEDLESLLESLPFIGGDDDGGWTAVASDDDMLVQVFDLVEQFGERGACLGERNDFGDALSVHNSVQASSLVPPAGIEPAHAV
jgi:hypothetical protein